ncbi:MULTISPECIES: AAA family ATPase [unclassified Treponema]|uniref:cytidylate kinase-like family protein n=1 Tax=unclassified Treponema TaxID=2638727 RepID=UPI000E915445|nr:MULTISPECIES: cytidylate kinase-like family protein [unclassified Treponema]HBP09169.1 cytidylate kinase-like family protein [Treponema sp.]
MKKYITISREYGSGGHTIGSIVAKELGIPFYDNEIIDLAAKDSGLHPDFIKKNEQNISSGWLYTLLLGASYATPGTGSMHLGMNSATSTAPLADQVFNAQRNAIIQLAKKGPCVIVGRCSDYVLRHCEEIDRKDILNIFIYAPLADKVQYAIKTKGLDPATAERDVKLIDKRRANHYNTFTERTWGNRAHYDMLINSSLLGMEKTAKMIAQIAKES